MDNATFQQTLINYWRAHRHSLYLESRIREHKRGVPYWNNPDYQGLDGLYEALNQAELDMVAFSVAIESKLKEDQQEEEEGKEG